MSETELGDGLTQRPQADTRQRSGVYLFRTFLYGLSFTAFVYGRTSDRNLFPFLTLLVAGSRLTATVAVCYESSVA